MKRPVQFQRAKAAAIALIILIVSIIGFSIVRDGQQQRLRGLVDTYGRVFSARLEERLMARFLVADMIRDEIAFSSPDNRRSRFISAVNTAHLNLADIQALNWVGPDGIIQIVTPLEGNERALGLNLFSLEVPAETLRAATDQDALRITPPIDLAQGGRGFVAYLPVKIGKDLVGYVNMVFKTEPLVVSAMDDTNERRFIVEILDGALPIHAEQVSEVSRAFAFTTPVSIGGRVWDVVVYPTIDEVEATGSRLDEGILIFGALLAIVVGLLFNEAATTRAQLQDREERFSLAMKGASDGLFDWNPITDETYFSPRWYQMLGYADGELPSNHDTFVSLVHPDDLEIATDDPEDLATNGKEVVEKGFRMRAKDGTWKTILSRAYIVRKGGKVVRVVGTHVDITEMDERQRALEKAAMTDELTGLRNRRDLLPSLGALMATLDAGEELAILHLDLDRFKAINDTHGHVMGDLVLQDTARRLLETDERFDFIARVGGDEFLLARKVRDGEAETAAIAARLIATIGRAHSILGAPYRLGASIGIAFVGTTGVSPISEAVTNADIALTNAKAIGRGRYVHFEEEMRTRALHSAKLTSEIEAALERGQFRAFLQPQIDLRTGRIAGFEALARWIHPQRGVLAAAEFIPFAERAHLIQAIDDLIFVQACQAVGEVTRVCGVGATIGVNVSTAQLSDPGLVDRMLETTRREGATPRDIRIEILESTVLNTEDRIIVENVRRLANAGFRLDLDDFGSGHAAITSLLDFPVSRVKIARTLVHDVANDHELQAITTTILGLGEMLGIEVLAEGVETREDLDHLASTSCDQVQGYLIARPMPLDALGCWAAEWQEGQGSTGAGKAAS